MVELKKILCIEDNLDIQTVIKVALISNGLTVQTCSTGVEALEVAVPFGPDLILLDVLMPEMDGPTTLKALREFSEIKDTPVIFMTALAQPSEIAQLKELGVLDIITKPFDPMSLADQINIMWMGRDDLRMVK